MISKEDFAQLINSLKEKLDDTTSALISEDLLTILGSFNNAFDDYEKMGKDMEKLKKDNDDLLKVNGRLYQKIGFDKPVENEEVEDNKEDEESIQIEDVIDEKGEII